MFNTPPTGPTGSSVPYLTVPNTSSVPSESSQPFSTQAFRSSHIYNATSSYVFSSGHGHYTSSFSPLSPSTTNYASQMSTPPTLDTTNIGTVGSPLTGGGFRANGTNLITSILPSGTAVEHGKLDSSRIALTTGRPGNTHNENKTHAHNATILGIKGTSPIIIKSISATLTFANSTIIDSLSSNLTSDQSAPTQASRAMLAFEKPRVTDPNALPSSNLTQRPANSTFSNMTKSVSTINDTTAVHPTMSVVISSNSTSNITTPINSTLSASTLYNSTSPIQGLSDLILTNPMLNNTEIVYLDGNRRPVFAIGTAPIPDIRHNKGVTLDTNTTHDGTGQCSGIMTVVPGVRTITFTAVEVVYQLTTVFGNATTPSPEYVLPLKACSTFSSAANANTDRPGEGQSVSSVLLVTKKIPVVVRSPQTVGPIYNLPPSSAQPVQVQPTADAGQAGDPSAQKMQQSGGEDRSAGSAPLQQAFALADNLASSNSLKTTSGNDEASPVSVVASSVTDAAGSRSNPPIPISNSGGSGSGTNGASSGSNTAGSGSTGASSDTNGGQSPGNSVQPAIAGHAPGVDRQTSSGGQATGNDGRIMSGGQSPSEGQKVGGDQNSKGGEQAPNGNIISGSGTGDQSASTSGQPPPVSSQLASGQTVPGQSSAVGADTGSQNVGSVASNPTSSDAKSGAGNSFVAGSLPSEANDYPVKAVDVNNIPIYIDSAVVIVGSQTVNAGSPPTTIIANGQTVTVDQSQLVASGTTIPIEAAVASNPASSITIGSVPVVLQPSNVVIGSNTFSHGSSAAFAVYNDQTYSWDAKQFVGPGGTMATFPSATSVAPRITAGGQVFSVVSSTLKAIGTDIAIPNNPSASPFMYQNQTFLVNPSQLVAPDMSITVPPATTQPTPFVYNEQTFSVDNSQFVAPSVTIPLSSGSGTVRYGTTVLTVDHTQIICPNTTITLTSVPQAGSPATPSAITTGGLTFSLGPAAAVITSSTYSFLPGQTPATATDQGQTVTLVSSGVHFGSIHVPIPTPSPDYSIVTQGSLTFSVAPSAVVFNGQTDNIQAGMSPRTTTVNGQEISIGAQGVGLAGTILPLPSATNPSGYSVVSQGDLTFSVAPSAVVLDGQTNSIRSGMTPITTIVHGQTISIGPQGVGISNTTIPLPAPPPAFAIVTQSDLTFSVAPTEAVVRGSTFGIGPNKTATIVLDGQTIGVGPSEIMFPGTTVNLPSATSNQPPAEVTADGLTFAVGPTEAVVGGTTYAIGSGAVAKTIVVGSESISLGPNGIVLPSTTIPPQHIPTAVTADGLTFLADATEAIINGTAYAIGSEAIAKTIVYGSGTIGLGTKGIVFPSTTVVPWGNATQTSLYSMYSASGAAVSSSMSLISAAADKANAPPTGLPVSFPGGTKSDIHRGTGQALRPPTILILAATLGGLMLRLWACL